MPLAPPVVTEPAGDPVWDEEVPEATATWKGLALVVAETTKFRPLLAVLIHQVGLTEMAHGLRNLAFVVVAGTEPSDTRLVTL